MTNPPEGPDRKRYIFNLALAGMTAQVGCLTLVIVLGAVFLGLWLDGIFQTRPWFTIGLVIASIPISVVAMVILARMAVSKIKTGSDQQPKSQ